jgi:hypothetical protein
MITAIIAIKQNEYLEENNFIIHVVSVNYCL